MEENTPQKVTAKQRVLEAQGRAVPVDLFLYSCLEQERLLKATAGSGAPLVNWPALAGKQAEALRGTPVETLMARLFAWYRESVPAMAGTRALDHEMLSEVVPGVVGLSQDLETVYRLSAGEAVPQFEGASSASKFWTDLSQAVRDNFPTYADFFLQYLQWTHAVEKVEHFEPGSRPPIGKYAPPMPRRDDRGGRGGDRGGRGGSDRGPRSGGDRGPRPDRGGDRPPRPEFSGNRPERPEADGNRPPRGDGDRGPRGPRSGGGSGRDRGPRPDRGDRGPRRGGGSDEATIKMTEAATAEAAQAIAALQSDTSLNEVTLKPINSFYRRIQHQAIVDAGFHSESVGEGNERAVKIVRK